MMDKEPKKSLRPYQLAVIDYIDKLRDVARSELLKMLHNEIEYTRAVPSEVTPESKRRSRQLQAAIKFILKHRKS